MFMTFLHVIRLRVSANPSGEALPSRSAPVDR